MVPSPHAHPGPVPPEKVISHSLYRSASRRRERVTLIGAFSLVDDPLPQRAQHHHTQSKGKSAIDNPSWACHWVCLEPLSRTQTPCSHTQVASNTPLQGWLGHPACNHSHSLFTNDTPWALRRPAPTCAGTFPGDDDEPRRQPASSPHRGQGGRAGEPSRAEDFKHGR